MQPKVCYIHEEWGKNLNLHDFPLFPNTHPDALLGVQHDRLIFPHGWSGHMGGHEGGRTDTYTTILFNLV